MNNRWCIIGGPRTGSTWMSSLLIHRSRLYKHNVDLAEFFEHTNLFNFVINEHNFIEESVPVAPGDPYDLLCTRLDMIRQSNKGQPAVIKLFVKPYNFPELDYIQLIKEIQELNFQCLILKRNLLDRTISWTLANQTKIMHKWDRNTEIFLDTQDKGRIKGNVMVEQMVADTTIFTDLYRMILQEIPIMNQIESEFNFPIINYEKLKVDLISNKIFYGWSGSKKIYENPYNQFVINYTELVDIANKLNKEYNYEP
jgi:hypothetical protein